MQSANFYILANMAVMCYECAWKLDAEQNKTDTV